MELGLAAIAVAILVGSLILGKDIKVAFDRSGLDAAVQAVADGLAALAESIANPPSPPADLAEAQAAADETAAKLNEFASQLAGLKSAEDAEDAAG